MYCMMTHSTVQDSTAFRALFSHPSDPSLSLSGWREGGEKKGRREGRRREIGLGRGSCTGTHQCHIWCDLMCDRIKNIITIKTRPRLLALMGSFGSLVS